MVKTRGQTAKEGTVSASEFISLTTPKKRKRRAEAPSKNSHQESESALSLRSPPVQRRRPRKHTIDSDYEDSEDPESALTPTSKLPRHSRKEPDSDADSDSEEYDNATTRHAVQELITKKLVKLGWNLRIISRLHSRDKQWSDLLDKRVPLTHKAWVKLKPKLIRILKKTAIQEKIDRVETLSKNRKKRISELHDLFVRIVALPNAKALSLVEKKLLELYPKLIILPTAWEMITQNKCSTPITLTALKEKWPYILWELKREMQSPDMGYGQELLSLLPRERFHHRLEQNPGIDPKDPTRLDTSAASFFVECRWCHSSYLSYPALLDHHCLRICDYDHTKGVYLSNLFQIRCPHYDAGYKLLQALGLPLSTTHERMDEIGQRLVCLICPEHERRPVTWLEFAQHFVTRQRWTGWGQAVPHNLNHLTGYGVPETGTVKILSDEELAVYVANAPVAPPPVATTCATIDKKEN